MIMKTSLVAAFVAVMSAMGTQAHVGLKTPCARGQPAAGCPAPPSGSSFDYDINSPIGTHDSIGKPICRNTVPYTTRKVYRAGETINTDYSVGASHGGGHCQWALSYDDGKTWVVIKTMIRECLRGVSGSDKYSVPVQIPGNAPSGKATFQWIWHNAVGNREMYSNCADIEIQGVSGGSISGVEPLYANYGPSSVYIPEFPGADMPDNHEAFAKRKAITIRAPGSGSGPDPEPTTTKPTATPTTKPTTTTTKPKPTKPTTPSKKPTPKPTKTTSTKKPVKPTKTPTKKPAKPTKPSKTSSKKPTKPTKTKTSTKKCTKPTKVPKHNHHNKRHNQKCY
ncbi:hypothetical protein BGZ81_003159 [Podila clonocystis]|nr:hypothetical protein BGZ81_003159 [Podila clonocystis]